MMQSYSHWGMFEVSVPKQHIDYWHDWWIGHYDRYDSKYLHG